jgi:hypothetical protein
MNGAIRIDRVVAHLEVWLDQTLPLAKFKVKVLERSPGEFLAVPNVAVRNASSRAPEYISGLGGTVDEAVDDLLVRFVSEARQHSPIGGLTEADFEWPASEDF